MTTTIKVTAHCSSETEVIIGVGDVRDTNDIHAKLSELTILQDGESHELHAYDHRLIVVAERPKTAIVNFQIPVEG